MKMPGAGIWSLRILPIRLAKMNIFDDVRQTLSYFASGRTATLLCKSSPYKGGSPWHHARQRKARNGGNAHRWGPLGQLL